MISYISTRGGIKPVTFDEAVLQGFAADGGLFVPDSVPQVTHQQMEAWSSLGFTDLAFEILSLYIDRAIIPEVELKRLLHNSFSEFSHSEIIPLVKLDEDSNSLIMELFHGPTLSFKDMAMGFLINTLDYFLTKRKDRLSLILATTGDTGPAAAYAAAGKQTIDCWPLYPKGLISEDQERQMTTLDAGNVFPVGVENCKDGGDDLDLVVARLFAVPELKRRLKLSSVNSINWCRVMVQTVHYFFGYFRTVDSLGEKVAFSVPSGAFGNMFGGYLARSMGLPVETFICATNKNKTLYNLFSQGVLRKTDLQQSVSSAIDIVVPYNIWRFLYFATGCNTQKIVSWMDQFQETGEIKLDAEIVNVIQSGFLPCSISDKKTLDMMSTIYAKNKGYLLDPHGAVAVAAAEELRGQLGKKLKIICIATAHPAKFPDVVRKALQTKGDLPDQATHNSLLEASRVCQHVRLCDCKDLEYALSKAMLSVMDKHTKS